ncbi:MAG: site-specific integrase [Clostridiales bacterium]|nr:site-specific integrase [Clostridiales bacterium]
MSLTCSDKRTAESRCLQRSDEDLVHGVLNIRKSKGYYQHYVALHETMTVLLKIYDSSIDKIQPERTCFFKCIKTGSYYSRDWVKDNFNKLWKAANRSSSHAVAYDLRHHYAIENTNSWGMTVLLSVKSCTICRNPWGIGGLSRPFITIQLSPGLRRRTTKKQKLDLTKSYRRCGMKKIDDASVIARQISELLCGYALQFLTNSEHTLKGYKDTLTLYSQFLQVSGITPGSLTRYHLEKEWIEKWIIWLKESQMNSPDTFNNRLASIRRFLEYLLKKMSVY